MQKMSKRGQHPAFPIIKNGAEWLIPAEIAQGGDLEKPQRPEKPEISLDPASVRQVRDREVQKTERFGLACRFRHLLHAAAKFFDLREMSPKSRNIKAVERLLQFRVALVLRFERAAERNVLSMESVFHQRRVKECPDPGACSCLRVDADVVCAEKRKRFLQKTAPYCHAASGDDRGTFVDRRQEAQTARSISASTQRAFGQSGPIPLRVHDLRFMADEERFRRSLKETQDPLYLFRHPDVVLVTEKNDFVHAAFYRFLKIFRVPQIDGVPRDPNWEWDGVFPRFQNLHRSVRGTVVADHHLIRKPCLCRDAGELFLKKILSIEDT